MLDIGDALNGVAPAGRPGTVEIWRVTLITPIIPYGHVDRIEGHFSTIPYINHHLGRLGEVDVQCPESRGGDLSECIGASGEPECIDFIISA